MIHELRVAFVLMFLLMALTGLVYPYATLELGQLAFPRQANGSLIEEQGRVIGSDLLGQSFTGQGYFHPRPSAAGSGYDASNSSATNFGPTSAELAKAMTDRLAEVKQDGNPAPVPVDLVTASGSGLDPDISPASAVYQTMRIETARHIDSAILNRLIEAATEPLELGFLGERRVNVLRLNWELDRVAPVVEPAKRKLDDGSEDGD